MPVAVRVRRWAVRGLALPCGGVVALAFPAADAWWLGWVGLVPLVLLLGRAGSYGEAAWRSSLAAVGFFLVALQWLLPNIGMLALVVGVVVAALWVPFGLATYGLLREPSGARVALAVVVLPSVWVSVEALRSWEGLGGAWGLVGLTQWQVRPVLAVASLGGVWLSSLCWWRSTSGSLPCSFPAPAASVIARGRTRRRARRARDRLWAAPAGTGGDRQRPRGGGAAWRRVRRRRAIGGASGLDPQSRRSGAGHGGLGPEQRAVRPGAPSRCVGPVAPSLGDSVVLPAPRLPISNTIARAGKSRARFSPSAMVSSSEPVR